MQDCLSLLAVELDRLLLIERVDVGVAAIDKGAALDDVSLVPGCGVAKGAGASLDHVLEGLLGGSFDEGGPLDRPQLHPDADCLKVVQHPLADIRIGRVAVIIAAVKALRETSLSEELLALVGVVDRRRRLPEEFVIIRNDGVAGDQRITQSQRLVEAIAVDRQTGGPSYSLVMPRRLCVPLIGEINV